MSSALAALPRAVRRVGLPRIPPRALACLILIAAVAAPAWMWLRDSSLVRVRDVFITGLETGDGPRIRAALRSAAADMTTLNVREEALRAAVAAYPSVAGLRIEADFPRTLTIEVVEHVPVAELEVDGRWVPASGSGLLLRGARPAHPLPAVGVRGTSGDRVTDRRALIALDVLAAAPAGLRDRLDRATTGREGVVVEMRDGPDLIFGAAERARAKWLAAARVLADPGAAGAVYLDLRIPERVAAGGVGPLPTDEPSVPGSATATTTTATATVTAPATSSTATDPAVPAATPTPVPTATPAPTAPPAGTPETTAGGTAANPQP